MKLSSYITIAAFGAALALPATAGAQEISRGRNFGLGVVAGYPGFGLSMNVFFGQNMSLQIDPQIYAWSGDLWVGGRADLLFYPGRPIVDHRSFDLRWYIGPGLGFGVNLDRGYVSVVPEVPIGIGFQFKRVPIDLMVEAVPQFWIYTYDRGRESAFDIWVAGSLHARYYF